MRQVTIAIVLSLAFTAASANDIHPSTGRVFNQSEDSKIQYSCKLLKETLECEFIQVAIRSKLDSADAEQKLSEALAGFKKKGDQSAQKMCSDVSTIEAAFKGEEKNMSKKRFNSYMKSIALLKDFCAKPDIAIYEKMIKDGNQKSLNTCTIDVNEFRQKFKRNSLGNWLVISEPDPDCGLVRLDKFEAENSSVGKWKNWNYVSRKVVTNKKGSTRFGHSCSMYDEQEYQWNWRKREVSRDCEFIEFE